MIFILLDEGELVELPKIKEEFLKEDELKSIDSAQENYQELCSRE